MHPFTSTFSQRSQPISSFCPSQSSLATYPEHSSLQALEEEKRSIETYWNDYPHHQDIATMHTKILGQYRYQEELERKLGYFMMMASVTGVIAEKSVNKQFSSSWKKKRFIGMSVGLSVALVHGYHWFSIQGIHKNRGVYSSMPNDVKVKALLHNKYNLYQYVNDIKYNDTYLTRQQYLTHQASIKKDKQAQLEIVYKRLGL